MLVIPSRPGGAMLLTRGQLLHVIDRGSSSGAEVTTGRAVSALCTESRERRTGVICLQATWAVKHNGTTPVIGAD